MHRALCTGLARNNANAQNPNQKIYYTTHPYLWQFISHQWLFHRHQPPLFKQCQRLALFMVPLSCFVSCYLLPSFTENWSNIFLIGSAKVWCQQFRLFPYISFAKQGTCLEQGWIFNHRGIGLVNIAAYNWDLRQTFHFEKTPRFFHNFRRKLLVQKM